MDKIVIGIDPGSSGGIAVFNPRLGIIEEVHRTPNTKSILTTKKIAVRIDRPAFCNIIQKIIQKYTTKYDLIVHIEKVQGHPKQSPIASYNFGEATGIILGIVSAYNLETIQIPPQTWKRSAGLQASAKDEARLLVIDLFPELASTLRYKKDVDIADAILIAMHKP